MMGKCLILSHFLLWGVKVRTGITQQSTTKKTLEFYEFQINGADIGTKALIGPVGEKCYNQLGFYKTKKKNCVDYNVCLVKFSNK